MKLDDYPREILAHAPTPLEPLPRLSEHLGGPQIWVKRDDCTGLALGGNKARQLEYYFGEAVAEGADTILITGAVQSNFVRTTAAAAAKLGMRCEVQLEERVKDQGPLYHSSGNVLLNKIFGAVIQTYPEGEDEAGADAALEARAEALRAEGRRPYVIHLGADHPPLGALGYIDTAREISEQCKRAGLSPTSIVTPSGSAATHAGILGGLRLHGNATPVLGICVRRATPLQEPRVLKRVQEMLSMIDAEGIGEEIARNAEVEASDCVLAPGYGLFGEDVKEAITLAARLEGLLVDPVYSGKTLAGLIHFIRTGRFGPDDTLIFCHTGGAPALFGYDTVV